MPRNNPRASRVVRHPAVFQQPGPGVPTLAEALVPVCLAILEDRAARMADQEDARSQPAETT